MRINRSSSPGGDMKLRALAGLSLVVVGLVAAPVAAAQQSQPDFPIPGGWFYTQAARKAHPFGYAVIDDDRAAFWTELRRYGGVEVLGYPVSRRYFGPGGLLYQAFERVLLQWRPELGQAVIANLFEQFTEAGLDGWLLHKGIPPPIGDLPEPSDPGRTFVAQADLRMNWLTEPRILGFYLTSPTSRNPWSHLEQAWEFFGLPETFPERLTQTEPGAPILWPFMVQRFQKAAFQLWLEDVPGQPTRGSVAWVAAGQLARLSGLIPITAILAEPPPTDEPWLVGEPALVGTVVATGALRPFAIGGFGFLPGEFVTVTLVPDVEQPDQLVSRVTLTIQAPVVGDGSFTVEGLAPYGNYVVSAVGSRSRVSAVDRLILPLGGP